MIEYLKELAGNLVDPDVPKSIEKGVDLLSLAAAYLVGTKFSFCCLNHEIQILKTNSKSLI